MLGVRYGCCLRGEGVGGQAVLDALRLEGADAAAQGLAVAVPADGVPGDEHGGVLAVCGGLWV